MLRCAQSSRSNKAMGIASLHPSYRYGEGACPERKPKDRFFTRLASEVFLSSLQTEFFSTLLDVRDWKFTKPDKKRR